MAATSNAPDLDNLQQCLGLVSEIRNRSGTLWQTVAQGSSRAGDRGVAAAAAGQDGSEQPQQQQSNIGPPEKRFLSDLKALLDGVSSNLTDLEQRLNSQPPLGNPLPLGHSVYLCLDTSVENFPVYAGLASTYKWMDRAHEYSGGAASLLSQNSLNRSYTKVSMVKNRRRCNTIQPAPPGALENLINKIGSLYGDMDLTVTRPNGTKLNAIVEVSLGKVLKAVLVFKGMVIEWVVIRGWTEDSTRVDGQVDIWTESRYEVFRKCTHHASAAMLNFQSNLFPELSVKTFLTYLHSFNSLFTDKCKKCGRHLHNNLPPTWREYKTLEVFHEDCKI